MRKVWYIWYFHDKILTFVLLKKESYLRKLKKKKFSKKGSIRGIEKKVSYVKWVEFSMLVLISWAFRLNNFCPTTILTLVGWSLWRSKRSTKELIVALSAFPFPTPRTWLFMVGKNFVWRKDRKNSSKRKLKTFGLEN